MTLRARVREAARWLIVGAVDVALGALERWTQRPVPSDWHQQAERELDDDPHRREGSEPWP